MVRMVTRSLVYASKRIDIFTGFSKIFLDICFFANVRFALRPLCLQTIRQISGRAWIYMAQAQRCCTSCSVAPTLGVKLDAKSLPKVYLKFTHYSLDNGCPFCTFPNLGSPNLSFVEVPFTCCSSSRLQTWSPICYNEDRRHRPERLTMPNTRQTFPTLTIAERDHFDLVLAQHTYVSRPDLLDLLFGGLNDAEIVGKVGNAAFRTLNATKASVYTDESERKRKPGSSQVETLRLYIKRVFSAYSEAFGSDYPAADAFRIFDGESENLVDIWRVR